jgi:hypothetical protein
MNVQTWLQRDTAPEKNREYEIVNCPACTQMHFVNLASGKLLGDHSD